MSVISKPSLDVFPPVLTPYTECSEQLVLRGYHCPYCNGAGSVCGKQTGPGDYECIPCPVCSRTGRLRARIVINWEADVTDD